MMYIMPLKKIPHALFQVFYWRLLKRTDLEMELEDENANWFLGFKTHDPHHQ